ncbi:hypothetical protein D3C87_1120230 [compost metagenome]
MLEIAPVLGAGQQRAHVERVHDCLFQDVGYFVLGDAPRQALGDGGLAHASLAHQQRVVLASAAQHLHHALHLGIPADQRIDLAGLGQGVQVLGVLLERAFLAVTALALGIALAVLGRLGLVLADAVADEIDDIEARYPLLLQVVDRM